MSPLLGFIAGLGMQEILLLGICCSLPVIAITITLVVVFMMRRKKNSVPQDRGIPESEIRNT